MADVTARQYRNGPADAANTQPASEIKAAAEEYLSRVQPHSGFKWPHKNRLYAYLSGTDCYVGSKLGEAAKKGAFNRTDPLYNGLRQMIESGLQGIGTGQFKEEKNQTS
ncbi:MAG: hypothetical protein HDQ87_03600 [Clostridia bacterium]|nr:hypothetical protein [Clostridia bacterium]